MLDTQSAVKTEEFCFPSGDTDLSARLYLPQVEPSVLVVLNSATAVSMDFYKHFATWLAAENGMACLTYDYRDFGRSLKGRLQDAKSKMSDWALIDMPAARAEMRRRFPNAKLWVIGHSIRCDDGAPANGHRGYRPDDLCFGWFGKPAGPSVALPRAGYNVLVWACAFACRYVGLFAWPFRWVRC